MIKSFTILVLSAALVAPALAQADQHANHHPAQQAATPGPAQKPMSGQPMMGQGMGDHHAMMHGMMAHKGAMHSKKACAHPRHHRHCKARHHP